MRVLYFAWVREAVGVDEEDVALPPEVETVGALMDLLCERGEGYRRAFADRTRLRAAVDQAFVPLDASVAGASEVALFPPVTGG